MKTEQETVNMLGQKIMGWPSQYDRKLKVYFFQKEKCVDQWNQWHPHNLIKHAWQLVKELIDEEYEVKIESRLSDEEEGVIWDCSISKDGKLVSLSCDPSESRAITGAAAIVFKDRC